MFRYVGLNVCHATEGNRRRSFEPLKCAQLFNGCAAQLDWVIGLTSGARGSRTRLARALGCPRADRNGRLIQLG
jgi:hypothetical protein